MIPVLETAFFCCSVRTGTKVIGWFTVVLGIVVAVIFGISALTLYYEVSHEKMGKDEFNLTRKSILAEFQNLTQTMQTKDFFGKIEYTISVINILVEHPIFGLFSVILLSGAALLFLSPSILFSALLLVGVYKNKSGFVLFYLVLSTLGLIYDIYNLLSFEISSAIECLFELYLTWVIFSFYKELRRPKYLSQSATMLLPGQEYFDKNIPVAIPTANFNDYYYPKK